MKSFFFLFTICLLLGKAQTGTAQQTIEKEAKIVVLLPPKKPGGKPQRGTEKVKFITTRAEYRTQLIKGFEMKQNLGCNMTCSDIKQLAEVYHLNTPTKFNPMLAFDGGDLAYFSEEVTSVDELIRTFASRKIVLDALETKEITMALPEGKEQGYFSSLLGKILDMNVFQQVYFELKDNYQGCRQNNPSICFMINEESSRVCLTVKTSRIETVKGEMHKHGVDLGKTLTENDIRDLAGHYKLMGRQDCNIMLNVDRGAISFFYERFRDYGDDLNRLFAARKILLDAAVNDNPKCIVFDTPGDLDYAAETLIFPYLRD